MSQYILLEKLVNKIVKPGCAEYDLLNNSPVNEIGGTIREMGYWSATWYDPVTKLYHRDNDMPARVDIFSHYRQWYQNGYQHRDNDLPAYMGMNGKYWYQHGRLHRVGRPAIMADGKISYAFENFVFPDKVSYERWFEWFEKDSNAELPLSWSMLMFDAQEREMEPVQKV